MANTRKVSVQLEVNTSFVNKGTNLVKDFESQINKIDFGGKLTKGLGDEITRAVKDLYSGLDKIGGLGSKGLNAKEYTTAFNNIITGMTKSIGVLSKAGEEYTKIFQGEANKAGLKALRERKELLEDIKKIQTSMKLSSASASNTSGKLRDEFGLDTSNSYVKDTLRGLAEKRAANRKAELSGKEAGVLGKYATDEAAIKRIIELYNQEAAAIAKVAEKRNLIKDLAAEEGIKTSFDNIIPSIENSITKMEDAVITAEQYKAAMIDMGSPEVIEALEPTLIEENTAALKESQIQADKTAQAQANLREVMAQFGIILSAGTIARAFKNLIKDSFEFYKSLDSALNEIYVVSNLSIGAVQDLQNGFINMAKNTGMALDDITKSAVLFYQQGLNTDEVMEMTRVTSEFAKVAGIDATDAANKLTAAVNGYCLAAEDASRVADKFNKVAAASAADINELSTAFSKAAAQANQAGVSMDNYLAYIATMEEATREAPENIGTGLKTIFSRMQQIKTGQNTEDTTDVNAVETALRSVGIQLRDTAGQLRDLEEIFDELGPKWNQLDRNTQAYLGTIIAGTRQQSRFITLMQNWDRVQDLANQSANSAGQQALMHAKAMDSIESKLQQLHVAWQEFIASLGSSDLFKGVISSLTNLLNLINKGQRPLMLLALGVAALSNKLKDLGNVASGKIISAFAKMSGGLSLWKKDGYFKTDEQKNNALKENDDKIKALKEERKELEIRTNKLKESQEDEIENLGTIQRNKEGIKQIDEEINKLEKERDQIQKKQVMSTREAFGHKVSQVGMGAMALGSMMKDTTGSNVVTGLGMGAMGIGKVVANPADITGWISIISSGVSLFQTWANWSDTLKKKLEDAANKVDEKMSDVTNKTTEIQNIKQTQTEYEKLSKKVIKTADEQARLNQLAQELGDTTGATLLTDEYGNLSVKLSEVSDKIQALTEERNQALEELNEVEIDALTDATGGSFWDKLVGGSNQNSPSDYFNKLFNTVGSKYKTLLNDMEDGLNDQTRAVSENFAKSFQSNLKTSIMQEIKENADVYSVSYEGLAGTVQKRSQDFNKLSSSEWNELYAQVDFLKNNVQDMSFDEVQAHIDNFYQSWSGKTKLQKEEWEALVGTINNSVFQNESLINFNKQVDELVSKGNGEYFEKRKKNVERIANIKAGSSDLREEFEVKNEWYDYIPVIGTLTKAGKTLATEYVIATDERVKKIDAAREILEEINKEEEEYLETLAKEQGFINDEGKWDIEGARKWIDAQKGVQEVINGLNQDTAAFLTNLQSFTSFEDLTPEQAQEFASKIASLGPELEKAATQGEKVNILGRYIDSIPDSSPELKEKFKKLFEEAFNQLPITATKTFTQLGEELQTISGDLQTMNKIMDEFTENGAISLDTFMDLANILDKIDLNALGSIEGGDQYIDNMIDALDKLDLAFDHNSGMIDMNGDALQSLQKIQEAQTKSKIAGVIADLKASKASIESEIAMIDAQIGATEIAIQAMEADKEAKLTTEEIKAKADGEAARITNEKLSAIQKGYETDVENTTKWKSATIKNITEAAKAWNAYYTALKNGGSKEELDKLYAEADKKSKISWSAMDTNSGVDWSLYSQGDKTSQAKVISQLKGYLSELENAKAKASKSLKFTEQQIKLMEDLFNSDLSKLGTSKDKNGSDKLQKYIGQLKEIYNILNRIALLEHRLSTLDTYSDIAQGKEYGQLLGERLEYNEELLDQYRFLVSEQKQFTNGYKDFIGTVDGLEGVFDFDKYGQIIINWEKYNSLQDTAAKGQVSLKEKADDVYNTYTSMFKELQGYFDNYIKYLQNILKLLNETRDAYVNLENKTANAVKEIYQKILNTKLEAIDAEKDALDDLKEAREQANKDTKNAKDLSGMQTNMQRALMDTSGASDSAFIKAQMDMNNKLDEIAEDKYSTMLQDLQDTLDDEKEMLQKEFDEMFDNLDWLFDFLDQSIMSDPDSITNILKQTDEWNQKSPTEKWQDMRDWSKMFSTYFENDIFSEKGIKGVLQEIEKNESRIAEIDSVLKNQNTKGDYNIIQTIEKWGQNVASAAASAGGGRGGTGGSYGSPGSSTTQKDTGDGWWVGLTYTKKNIGAVNQKVNSDVQYGYFDTVDDTGTKYQPNNIGGVKVNKTGKTAGQLGIDKNSSGYPVSGQNVWTTNNKDFYVWNGTIGKYENVMTLFGRYGNDKLWASSVQKQLGLKGYSLGGLADFTGPAMLHGSSTQPEAVLNALQTKHFLDFTDALSKMYSGVNGVTPTMGGSINIGSISFEVESMSSPEDGEKAFNMFVDKFKEIGNQTGIKINSFKNTL